jgi:hypothetical protein
MGELSKEQHCFFKWVIDKTPAFVAPLDSVSADKVDN